MIRRLAAVFLVVVICLVWYIGVQRFTDFENADYGRLQSKRAADLVDEEWSTLRGDANRDLGRFMPGYGIGGAGIVLIVLAARGASLANQQLAAGAVWALVVALTADLIENLLFRSSLTRLLAGADPSTIDTRTLITQMATGLKWIGIFGWAASLSILTGRRVSETPV